MYKCVLCVCVFAHVYVHVSSYMHMCSVDVLPKHMHTSLHQLSQYLTISMFEYLIDILTSLIFILKYKPQWLHFRVHELATIRPTTTTQDCHHLVVDTTMLLTSADLVSSLDQVVKGSLKSLPHTIAPSNYPA